MIPSALESPDLLLTLAALLSASLVGLLASLAHGRDEVLRSWASAHGAALLALAVLAWGPGSRGTAAVTAGLACLAASAATHGIARLCARHAPALWRYLPPLLAPLAVLSLAHQPDAAAAVLGLVLFAQSVVAASLLRPGANAIAPLLRRSLMSALLGAGLIALWRAGTSLLPDPQPWTDAEAHGLTFALAVICVGLPLLARERAEAQVRELALADPLTGLHNRRSFIQLVQREFARAQRNGLPLTMLCIDPDALASVNDRYGRLGGDRALQALTDLLVRSLREQDVCARADGALFCVLLPETGLAGAAALAERLRQRVHGMLVPPDALSFCISAGVAEREPQELTADQLLRRCEQALRAAKAAGGNCVRQAAGRRPASNQAEGDDRNQSGQQGRDQQL